MDADKLHEIMADVAEAEARRTVLRIAAVVVAVLGSVLFVVSVIFALGVVGIVFKFTAVALWLVTSILLIASRP